MNNENKKLKIYLDTIRKYIPNYNDNIYSQNMKTIKLKQNKDIIIINIIKNSIIIKNVTKNIVEYYDFDVIGDNVIYDYNRFEKKSLEEVEISHIKAYENNNLNIVERETSILDTAQNNVCGNAIIFISENILGENLDNTINNLKSYMPNIIENERINDIIADDNKNEIINPNDLVEELNFQKENSYQKVRR